MFESRKSIKIWMSILLLGLTVGVAHAENGSAEDLDLRDQAVTEDLAADVESLNVVAEPDCGSDTSVAEALGFETVLPMGDSATGWTWTCGPCSISACANKPVGTPCGFNKYCVVTIVCSTQPYTDRCVCGTDHA